MTDRQRALKRYAKLLALARDQGAAPEGETARRLAEALAARWSFTEAEVSEGDPKSLPEPTASVPLGGDPKERYREEYRAYLLAALAELAGISAPVTYNAAAWVGHVYGAPERARAVTELYAALQTHIDREFRRFWVPRRFGTTPKAWAARSWWIGLVQGLRSLVGAPAGDGIVSEAVLALCDGTRGVGGPAPPSAAEGRRVFSRYRLDPWLLGRIQSLRDSL